MRYFIFVTLLVIAYLTQLSVASPAPGIGGSTGRGSSRPRGGGGGGDISAGMSTYSAPNTQGYLNLQNVLMTAGVLVLAQDRFARRF
ncbi:hypothetical protein BDA99DRAFT_557993 [Phascolomyces articulosus]|uniref:Uncharacterized protein n=1 Tax=Phascolomyces articulosus TaxID=60185 RepID=A0AAD5PGB1_9FUNG|nr:hypothetical protein BDA99DRAFT_557993 [Phascolomyces articulosus]